MPGKSNGHFRDFYHHTGRGRWWQALRRVWRCLCRRVGQAWPGPVLVARRFKLLQQLAARLTAQYGIAVRLLPIDLSEPEATDQIARKRNRSKWACWSIMRLFSCGSLLRAPSDDHLKEVDTNVRAPLALVNTFGRRMLAAGHGGIILMSSLSAFQGSAFISTYSATKAFNIVLAEGLWRNGVGAGGCAGMHRGCHPHTQLPGQLPKAYRPHLGRTLEPEAVVAEALSALGHRPTVIPGRLNRLSSFVMRRLLSRRAAVHIMGEVLRGMYVHEESK